MTAQKNFDNWLQKCRQSKSLILYVVSTAMFLDSMLITCVVPIVPELIYDLEHPNSTLRNTESTVNTATEGTGSVNETVLLIKAKQKHEDLLDESMRLGVLLASKSIINLLVNPIVGFWTDRIGVTIPLFVGFVVFVVSTSIFAFAKTYVLLLIARSIQGIGSACTNVAGMATIPKIYQDKQRADAFSIMIGALAIGLTAGPVYGGLLYEFTGQTVPFLVLAVIGLLVGCLQIVILRPKIEPAETESTSVLTLIKDPYIILTAGAITTANISFGVLEPSLPIRLLDKVNASRSEIGIIYVTSLVGYLTASRTNYYFSRRMPKWLIAMVGLILVGVFLILIQFTVTITEISVPTIGYGFATGLVDVSMMPLFSYLVDIRHTGVYGNVYAIGDFAWAMSYAIGPVIGGALMQNVGFEWMVCIVAVMCFLYAPLMFFLRCPPVNNQKIKHTDHTPLLKNKPNP